nr:AlNc14C312G10501 [Albugo laibachii Nc14]|eukprot:CCA25676.1 AlNc14C312G10501 [Albugo laibachii Nc14]
MLRGTDTKSTISIKICMNIAIAITDIALIPISIHTIILSLRENYKMKYQSIREITFLHDFTHLSFETICNTNGKAQQLRRLRATYLPRQHYRQPRVTLRVPVKSYTNSSDYTVMVQHSKL